jgi:mannose-6-phosphate isomerase-like protein (cupin superfamily)
MTIFRTDIEKKTTQNTYYRKVLFTNKQQQLVLMSLKENESVPCEIHKKTTQFVRIESGKGVLRTNEKVFRLSDGVSLTIGPNTFHEIVNTGTESLKFYTIYSPPEHSKDCVQRFSTDPDC